VAPDKFRGTYSSREAAEAIARGLGPHAQVCPTADGGEGTLAVLLDALEGERLTCQVHDPLGRERQVQFGLLADGELAIVESASASGLALLTEAERDPEYASTFGTGELIVAAAATGASRVAVAVGGAASTDGGMGAVEALARGGGLRGAQLIVLADVDIAFERAAAMFAPQKGADEATVARLSARLQTLAAAFPRDPRGVPMTGAAGGLAGGLWAHAGAELVRGAAWVLDAVGFQERLAGADAVVSGEGRLDATTLQGKLLSEIARRCAAAGVPLHAVVGSCALGQAGIERLGLRSVREASTLEELELAGRALTGETAL